MAKMTIGEFFDKNNLQKNLKIFESSKTYRDANGKTTSEKILYINLSADVDGQDYLVLSRNLAKKVRENQDELTKAQVQSTEFGWGLICASTVKVFGTVTLQ